MQQIGPGFLTLEQQYASTWLGKRILVPKSTPKSFTHLEGAMWVQSNTYVKAIVFCFANKGYKRSFAYIQFRAIIQAQLLNNAGLQKSTGPSIRNVTTDFRSSANKRQLELQMDL